MGKPYLFFIYKLKLVTLDNIYSYMHSHKIIESLSMLHLYSMFLTWLQGCYTCTQGRRTQWTFGLRGDRHLSSAVITLCLRCFTLDSEIYIYEFQHVSQLEIWNYLYSTAHWPGITTLCLIWIYLQPFDIIIHDFSIFNIAKIHAFY